MTNQNKYQDIVQLFDTILEPQLKWSLNALNLVQSIEIIDDNTVHILANIVTKSEPEIETLHHTIKDAVTRLGFSKATVNLQHVNIAVQGLSKVAKVIFVGSGKGGVGKSNVAVNIACALAKLGYKTGLMDADITGPSMPTMLGIHSRPEVLPDEHLRPIEKHGIKSMSIGFLVNKDDAIDWRGQIQSGTLIQFIEKTFWEELDYLIIDLPPGTGDIVLTLSHKIKCDGVILVSTPTQLAVDDVKRAQSFFEEREVPILGLVENMSHQVCQKCGHTNLSLADLNSNILNLINIPKIASIPLSPDISIAADKGVPLVLTDADLALKAPFEQIVQHIVQNIPCNIAETVHQQV